MTYTTGFCMSYSVVSPLPNRKHKRSLWPLTISVETLALLVSVFFSLISNAQFWHTSLATHHWLNIETWRFATGVFVALTALQFSFIALILTRHTARPILSLLLLTSAIATYFMQKYNVFLDASMLRNVLHTDVAEARELLSPGMLVHILWQAGIPIWLIWNTKLIKRTWRGAILWRIGAVSLGLIVGCAALFLVLQDFSPLIRNQKGLRYLITPGNYLVAVASAVSSDARQTIKPQTPIGLDAIASTSWQHRKKPALLVIVIGETTRSASWGLNGYARQTTPELSQIKTLINFSNATSCGTNTETSVPCLFSPWGRRYYDENRIRSHQSLLHIFQRSGFQTLWRDNQSGCKGVCTGLTSEQSDKFSAPELCKDGRCFDEVLLHGLDKVVESTHENRVIVLHQLGSHGPAYFKRYPSTFHRFTPTCDTEELRNCDTTEIVNAYDNSVLYTDHFLASVIQFLQSQQSSYDTAMLYASDHGESLGEHGFFLHGIPRAFAPDEQTHIPMVMWLSQNFSKDFGINLNCLHDHANNPVNHDYIFHTALGMLDIQTKLYDSTMDLTYLCRTPSTDTHIVTAQ